MKKLLVFAGVKFQTGIVSLFKEKDYPNQAFHPYVYESLFEQLASDGEDFVHFNNFMPYLMIFFLFSQF